MPRLRYQTVDVFTDRVFGGNQLAVVLDARALASLTMQAIAAEFNFAETTFVLPPKDPAHTAHVRIFTPRAEVPFAGHPNVGTGFVLARLAAAAGRTPRQLVFEEQAGLVPIAVLTAAGEIVGAELTAPQPLTLGRELAPDMVARCAGLRTDDIDTTAHRPVLASVGMGFALAAVKAAALSAARPSVADFAAHWPAGEAAGLHLYVRDGTSVRARMFAPLLGVPEDPATGSANAALAAFLARRDGGVGRFALDIVQGVEMGRPSRLAATVENGAVRIGGRCVAVMEGEISVPE